MGYVNYNFPIDFFKKKARAIREAASLRRQGLYAKVTRLKKTKNSPSGYQVFIATRKNGNPLKRKR